MADEADVAEQQENRARLEAIRNNSKPLIAGVPGECYKCEEYSQRLVLGACAPCRDKYKLP